MPSLFTFGRKIYSDRVHELNANDLQHFFKLYKMKYWGLVETDTWQKNEKAAMGNEGEIKAKYLTESGIEVFLVRTADRNTLYFLVQADIDDSFMERYEERQREEQRQYEAEMERMREAVRNSSPSPRGRTRQTVSEPQAQEEIIRQGLNFFESMPYTISGVSRNSRSPRR
jgi:hypothetical protein